MVVLKGRVRAQENVLCQGTAQNENGGNISPRVAWLYPPAGTVSFALTVHDPAGGNWSHWVIWDIPGTLTFINSNLAGGNTVDLGNGYTAYQGENDFIAGGFNSAKIWGYDGPCPPEENHNYYFTLYALNTNLGNFNANVNRAMLLEEIDGKTLDSVNYNATYP